MPLSLTKIKKRMNTSVRVDPFKVCFSEIIEERGKLLKKTFSIFAESSLCSIVELNYLITSSHKSLATCAITIIYPTFVAAVVVVINISLHVQVFTVHTSVNVIYI